MKERLAKFDPQCNKITERLFLGSETVAKNKALLDQNGVTHILNCAGTICLEYFPQDFSYKYLSLVDGKSEDVSCLLYDVVEWFEEVLAADPRHKIFVHCQQGVSRSTTMLIAYLMWLNRTPFEATLHMVKQIRDICNPNQNFFVQLLDYWKRISGPPSATRLYQIQPHTIYSPQLIVSKEVRLAVGAKKTDPDALLDSRGVYLLTTPACVFVWVGKESIPLLLEGARVWARRYCKFERIPGPPTEVSQGLEPASFWEALGCQTAPPSNFHQPAFDHICNNVLPLTLSGKSLREEYREKLRLQLISSGVDPTKNDQLSFSDASVNPTGGASSSTSRGSKHHVALFQAPDFEPMGTFDIDDLSDDSLFALVDDAPTTVVYIWVGSDYHARLSSKKARTLARACLEKNPKPTYSKKPIVHLIHEDKEPEEFWTYFH